MTAPEITAEMVMELTPVRREVAERIAAYATHRIAGLSAVDACRETGVSTETGSHYAKVVAQLCQRLGLPEPPKGGRYWRFTGDHVARGARGGRQRNHVQRGIIAADCPLCQGGTPDGGAS